MIFSTILRLTSSIVCKKVELEKLKFALAQVIRDHRLAWGSGKPADSDQRVARESRMQSTSVYSIRKTLTVTQLINTHLGHLLEMTQRAGWSCAHQSIQKPFNNKIKWCQYLKEKASLVGQIVSHTACIESLLSWMGDYTHSTTIRSTWRSEHRRYTNVLLTS